MNLDSNDAVEQFNNMFAPKKEDDGDTGEKSSKEFDKMVEAATKKRARETFVANVEEGLRTGIIKPEEIEARLRSLDDGSPNFVSTDPTISEDEQRQVDAALHPDNLNRVFSDLEKGRVNEAIVFRTWIQKDGARIVEYKIIGSDHRYGFSLDPERDKDIFDQIKEGKRIKIFNDAHFRWEKVEILPDE